MKKRNWMAGVCGAAVMGLLIAGTGTASAGTIPTGFQVGGFDLSGMTREEADQTIEKSIGEMENQTISIRVEGHEVQTTAAELGETFRRKSSAPVSESEGIRAVRRGSAD